MSKIAINGFGRIGRLTARVLLNRFPNIQIVAVNDLTDAQNLAYLFKYDTTYHKFNGKVEAKENKLFIETDQTKQEILVLSERDPANLPWKEMGVDLVIESTGLFTSVEKASLHLQAGAKKVLLSAPAKGAGVPTVVLGVNDIPDGSDIISNASCTTNCVAPALKVLEDNFGISQAFGITAHAYTATQMLQDGPTKKVYRDGRAAAQNLIPSSTGAAKAVFEVLPTLKGKLNLSALRVPTITGSMVYMTLELNKETTVEELNQTFKTASETTMKNILEYTDEDIVSSDIIANTNSCIFDSKQTEIMGKTAKIVVWYDNEWGYSNRLAELVQKSVN
jgi:glyceraldehyde 3-phosphate dehydrogenase